MDTTLLRINLLKCSSLVTWQVAQYAANKSEYDRTILANILMCASLTYPGWFSIVHKTTAQGSICTSLNLFNPEQGTYSREEVRFKDTTPISMDLSRTRSRNELNQYLGPQFSTASASAHLANNLWFFSANVLYLADFAIHTPKPGIFLYIWSKEYSPDERKYLFQTKVTKKWYIINQSNFYSTNIPSEARLSGTTAKSVFNSKIEETVP